MTAAGDSTVACIKCGTLRQRFGGNGRLCSGERRGTIHTSTHCPTCNRQTWSVAFKWRPIPAREIASMIRTYAAEVGK